MKNNENMQVWKRKSKSGPGKVRTRDHGEHLCTVNVLTTTPSVIWCWESGKQNNMNDDASWMSLKLSQRAWGPGGKGEPIRTHDRATHASPESTLVSDAGALAPVVFSDDQNVQTCKIRRIEAKERPNLHNLTLLSSMALLVSIENGCIMSFEEKNINFPNNGNLDSG